MTARAQVIGAGGHARVVVATLRDAGFDVTAVWDDDPKMAGRDALGVPVRGTIDDAPADIPTVLAVGDNRARARLAARRAFPWATAVHPRAYVHSSVTIGPGTVVFAGAVIQPGAVLGAHVIVNTSASIDHDCQLGDFVHLAPGVRLCGAVSIGDGALLGVGAVAIPGAKIGAWATIGAGAVVISPIAAESTAVGVPARVVER